MFPCEPLRKGKPEAGALDAAGERIMCSIEGVENLLLLTGGNSRTAIEDADADRLTIDIAVQVDFLPFARILLGIGKEIDQDLRQRVVVAHGRIGTGSRFPASGEATFLEVQRMT